MGAHADADRLSAASLRFAFLMIAFLIATPRPAMATAPRAPVVVPVHLWLAASDDPEADRAWVDRQLEVANDRFADVRVAFRLVERSTLPASEQDIETATLRDRVGRERHQPGRILWIVPRSLRDLDGVQVRRGVHWRDRSDRRGDDANRRWVITARGAFDLVLAHELGHFFGLPHNRERLSFMNKTQRPVPMQARRLTARERRRVEARTAAMIRAGTLRTLPDDSATR